MTKKSADGQALVEVFQAYVAQRNVVRQEVISIADLVAFAEKHVTPLQAADLLDKLADDAFEVYMALRAAAFRLSERDATLALASWRAGFPLVNRPPPCEKKGT